MRRTRPAGMAWVNGVGRPSTRRWTSRHSKRSDALRVSAPSSRPASQAIWNPLQMASTGPPLSAKALTAAMIGECAAIAPARR